MTKITKTQAETVYTLELTEEQYLYVIDALALTVKRATYSDLPVTRGLMDDMKAAR